MASVRRGGASKFQEPGHAEAGWPGPAGDLLRRGADRLGRGKDPRRRLPSGRFAPTPPARAASGRRNHL